jgi:hypothetical protein
LLKIDVQGAELMVLQGADKVLDKVNVIFTEVTFNKLYDNGVLFNELYQYLISKGYKLEGFENISQSTVDGTFLQADDYFVKLQ